MAALGSVPSTPRTPGTPRTPRTPGFNTKSPTIKRIMQEARELAAAPDPAVAAAPLETDLFEWHFTLRGPPGTPYADGLYHGRIVLPAAYPLRPPAFRFLTPSGRFEVNREICLSISGHHEESWQPAWGVRTALCALRAFMAGEAQGQLGGLDMPPAARAGLARASRAWRCPACGARTNEELMAENAAAAAEAADAQGGAAAAAAAQVEVPAELRLAYKDTLQSPAPPPTPGAPTPGAPTPGAAAPPTPRTAPLPREPPAPSESTQAGATGPPPTPRTPAAPVAQAAPAPAAQPTAVIPEPIPMWMIDVAIVAVVIGLVIMLFRALTGWTL